MAALEGRLTGWCGTPNGGSDWSGTDLPAAYFTPSWDDARVVADPHAGVRQQIEEEREQWSRTCRAYASELDGALAALGRANGAVAIPVDADRARELRAELAIQNLGGAERVREWWHGLTERQRLSLIAAYPGLISRLDGIPPHAQTVATQTRHTATLVRLESLAADGTLTDHQQQRLARLQRDLSTADDDHGATFMPVSSTFVVAHADHDEGVE